MDWNKGIPILAVCLSVCLSVCMNVFLRDSSTSIDVIGRIYSIVVWHRFWVVKEV